MMKFRLVEHKRIIPSTGGIKWYWLAEIGFSGVNSTTRHWRLVQRFHSLASAQLFMAQNGVKEYDTIYFPSEPSQ